MSIPNSFKGAAKRIEDIDLPRVGHRIGVSEDAVHAVLDVESSGSGFDKQGRPKMLFEPHIFYRELGKGAARDRAVAAGLARPKWKRDYPKDSYPRLVKAMGIDRIAALRSASWGLGQIMGFNHLLAGYHSVEAMVLAFMDDEDEHLEAMIAFIVSTGLDDELRALEAAQTREERVAAARAFARGYNGSGYAQNNYHTRIADRFEWWRGKPNTQWNPADAEREEAASNPDFDMRQPDDPGAPSPAPKSGWAKLAEIIITALKALGLLLTRRN